MLIQRDSQSPKYVCFYAWCKSVTSDDVRSANIIAEDNGVECLVIDREWVFWHFKCSFMIWLTKYGSLCNRRLTRSPRFRVIGATRAFWPGLLFSFFSLMPISCYNWIKLWQKSCQHYVVVFFLILCVKFGNIWGNFGMPTVCAKCFSCPNFPL